MGQITPEQPSEAVVVRPLRRDAELNRQRILTAAEELFAQRGLSVTLDDIAAHAGVGVGTVYRRFADRDALVDALFKESIDDLAVTARAALDYEDPFEGLVFFMESHVSMQIANRGFAQVVLSDRHGHENVEHAKAAIKPLIAQILKRTQDAGLVRPDLEVTDIPVLVMMFASVLDASRDVAPELWRRPFSIILDGMRVGSTTPFGAPPLPEEDVQDVMRCGLAR